ncbi:hypothetical protein [Dyella nitratireducens]|uniref:Uncharacterized protein n=1 Tax=Dyella nitratireducens TaxID=1849580 RepID=A0ABQ1FRH3_9GAMM|nr:hypothetical protein [Dyella nitratireducens]GGA28010.1 hypothetical protein GCM10010981_15980 [Dyella nitratireducens]GLQ43337.1 hypothetical protein GCM10007902_31870 [Dyella nitratireducens]
MNDDIVAKLQQYAGTNTAVTVGGNFPGAINATTYQGTVSQVDTDGGTVTIHNTVYNRDNDVSLDQIDFMTYPGGSIPSGGP